MYRPISFINIDVKTSDGMGFHRTLTPIQSFQCFFIEHLLLATDDTPNAVQTLGDTKLGDMTVAIKELGVYVGGDTWKNN